MPLQSHIAQRIYYDEQQCLEFTAQVTEIRELTRVDGRGVFQIALDRTAFYPTGGGQPHDTGSVVAKARSGAVLEAPILEVTEDEAGEVWHTTMKPLQPGTAVTGYIDMVRRFDHMQQHSGQHLLSAISMRELGAATIGFRIGEKASTVDLSIDTVERSQVERLEDLVNEAVSAALPIVQESVPLDTAQQMLAGGELRKLPERSGSIRLIHIQGTDHNACGGTHVASTAEIGPVLLRKTERVRGKVRLTFLCGKRARNAIRQDWNTLSEAALQVSSSPEDLNHRITRMQAELKTLRKQLRAAQDAPSVIE